MASMQNGGLMARSRWLTALFCMALALLVTHELDAMSQYEWRLMPVLGQLGDELGQFWFITLHVPLFAVIFWLLLEPLQQFRQITECVLDVLIVLHAGLHFLLSNQPLYTFHTALSQALIFAAAMCAFLHFTLVFRLTKKAARNAKQRDSVSNGR